MKKNYAKSTPGTCWGKIQNILRIIPEAGEKLYQASVKRKES